MNVKIAIFAIFVLVGFAAIAGMFDLFMFLQEKIGNGDVPLIKLAKENFWPIIFGVWILMFFGMAIALHTMIKDGFFGDEPATTNTQPTQKVARMPAQALPPLELQIKSSPLIIHARTQTGQGRVWYYVIDVLKSTSPTTVKKDSVTNIDTKSWEMLGYVPIAYQEVVFFFTEDQLPFMSPLEALVVQDGKISYGKGDPVIEQELTIEELKNKASL